MKGIIVVLGIVVLVIGAVIIRSNQAASESNLPFEQEVTRTGQVVCLPHKDTGGPQTLECAFGLLTAERDHYTLNNLDQESIMTAELGTQSRVSVAGVLSAPEPEQIYDTVGTIDVEELELIEGEPASEQVETRLDQGASALGLKVVPVEILEDRRCAADALCVQAGLLSVRSLVSEGGELEQEEIFVLETPVVVGAHTVELVRVEPEILNEEEIDRGDYRLHFIISEQ